MLNDHKWKNAVWIWHDEMPPPEEYRRGWFRYRFQAGAIESAWLDVAVNAGFVLYVNGVEIAREQPNANYRYDIAPWLTTGQNVIAVDAECKIDTPFGLLAFGCVTAADGEERILQTDESWRMTNPGQDPEGTADWVQPDFDDTGWQPARSVERHLLTAEWMDAKTPLVDPNDVHNGQLVGEPAIPDMAAVMAGLDPDKFHAAVGTHCPNQKPIAADRISIVTDGGLFPALCRLDDGDILAVVRSGASHVGMKGRMDMVRSTDEGRTWSQPVTLADSENDERGQALGQLADGSVVMAWRTAVYYCEGPKIVETTVYSHLNIIRSTDGGCTWSPPVQVDVSPHAGGTAYRRIITPHGGRALLPFYSREQSCALWSDDNGLSWTGPQVLFEGAGENAYVQLANSELLSLGRTGGWMHLRRSSDLGETWSEPTLFSHENRSVHPGDFVLMRDGRILATYGYRMFPYGTRARISEDDGHTWSDEFILIHDSLNWDCGYPASVELSGGRILSAQYATASRTRPELGVHCMGIIWDPGNIRCRDDLAG